MTPTTLYRFFDANDRLLYVGITSRSLARWAQHATVKSWWQDVARTTVEHYPDRPAALEAERTAIKAEGPKYNIKHSTNGAAATDTTSAPSQDESVYEVAAGDVIVVRHAVQPTPPVGMVKWVGERGFKLRLYRWGTGTFDGPLVFVRWDHALQIAWMEEMTKEEIIADGWNPAFVTTVFDMDPAASYQERWAAA